MGNSGYLQRISALWNFAVVVRVLTAPEYFDHQGTGAITKTVSLDTILWRLIVTDQPPGIWNAIGKFQLPKPEIVVCLLFGGAQVITGADSGNVFRWVQVSIQGSWIHTDLL